MRAAPPPGFARPGASFLMAACVLVPLILADLPSVAAALSGSTPTAGPAEPAREQRIHDLIAVFATPPDAAPHGTGQNSPAQRKAMDELVRIGPAATPLLVEALHSEGKWQRGLAAETLGRIGDPRGVPALIQTLQQDACDGVRSSAAVSLAQIEDPRVVKALIGGLKDDEPVVRYVAARELGDLKAKAAVEPLARLLGDRRPQSGNTLSTVGEQAVTALVAIGPSSVPALLRARKSGDVHAMRNAVRALEEIAARRDRSRKSG